ncbi:hypothetical protein [Prosthecodimorpha staleyi]|uniref:Sulfur globule protein n=1 Tax=Prosthecodimorpha staleyi TaxID=2840188 RepID=A0A947D7B2_9HYPH|nr:hypothetical protein [Prosthecodimorpha staleyi]MBT9290876.1 hypothetical protein [Prosthecodimorpha staleyi]
MKKLVLGLAAAAGLALVAVPATTSTAEAGWKHHHKWHGHHGHWHGGKVVVRPWGYPAYYGYYGCRWKVKYRGHHAYKVKVCY